MSTNPRLLVLGIVLGAALSGCGHNVTLKSEAFPLSGSTSALVFLPTASVSAPTATVTDFKVCIESIRLQNDSDQVQQKDGQDDIAFKPGLIDLSDGKEHDWGTLSVPTGFKLKRLTVKVHQDPGECGVDYSIKFNDTTTQQDVELKFSWNPPTELKSGDTLKLSLNSLIANLRAAVDAGTISSLKDRVEEVEGSISE
jgi:hypothetical protein